MMRFLLLTILFVCAGCSKEPDKAVSRESSSNTFAAKHITENGSVEISNSENTVPATSSTFDMAEVERLTTGFSDETELVTKVKAGIPISSNELCNLITAYNGKQDILRKIIREGYYFRENTAQLYAQYLEMATNLAVEVGPMFYKAELAEAYAHFGAPDSNEKIIALADGIEKPKITDYSNKASFLDESSSYRNLIRDAASRIAYNDYEAAAEMYLKAVSTEHKSFLPPMLDAAEMYQMAGKVEKAIEILIELINMPPEKKYIVPDITVEGKPMPEWGKAYIISVNEEAIEKGKINLEDYKRYLKNEQKTTN